MKTIYLDNAATTRVHPEVAEAMQAALTENYANPSSLHSAGRMVRKVVEDAREVIAKHIGAQPKEIIFTATATEANNLAIFGTAAINKEKGRHIIVSAVEHHSVLEPCHILQKEGFEISFAPVNSEGIVDIEALAKLIRKDTILVAVMFANNETGAIQPIKEVGKIANEHSIPLLCDAVQAIGKLKVDVNDTGVTMLSMTAHKLYGPKGAGALFIRRSHKLKPIIFGGGHEFEKRAGTENVAGIVGLAEAVKIAYQNIEKNVAQMARLKDQLKEGLLKAVPDCRINGSQTNSLPNILNVNFQNVEGEAVVLSLDSYGICVSTGSACASESSESSHVLLAMGLSHAEVKSSIRFSLSIYTTQEEIELAIQKVTGVINKLRKMSPV